MLALMDTEPREESDQLPEEAPTEQAVDDGGDAAGRNRVSESPGAADDDSEGDESTGNPANAG